MEKFTDSELYFINCVENDKEYFISNKINDIAKKFYTSKATIIRVVKKMKFANIKAMQAFYAQKKKLQELTAVDDNYIFNLYDLNQNLKTISALTIQPIIETTKIIDLTLVEKIAIHIANKKGLILFGLGNSNHSLHYFYNMLKRINVYCSIHSSVGGLLTELNFVTQETMIIIASNSLQTKEIKWIFQQIKDCQIVIIKNKFVPDIIQDNIWNINYVYNTKEKYRFPMISSSVSQQFVLNIIFNAILSKVPQYIGKIRQSDAKVKEWNEN